MQIIRQKATNYAYLALICMYWGVNVSVCVNTHVYEHCMYAVDEYG